MNRGTTQLLPTEKLEFPTGRTWNQNIKHYITPLDLSTLSWLQCCRRKAHRKPVTLPLMQGKTEGRRHCSCSGKKILKLKGTTVCRLCYAERKQDKSYLCQKVLLVTKCFTPSKLTWFNKSTKAKKEIFFKWLMHWCPAHFLSYCEWTLKKQITWVTGGEKPTEKALWISHLWAHLSILVWVIAESLSGTKTYQNLSSHTVFFFGLFFANRRKCCWIYWNVLLTYYCSHKIETTVVHSVQRCHLTQLIPYNYTMGVGGSSATCFGDGIVLLSNDSQCTADTISESRWTESGI